MMKYFLAFATILSLALSSKLVKAETRDITLRGVDTDTDAAGRVSTRFLEKYRRHKYSKAPSGSTTMSKSTKAPSSTKSSKSKSTKSSSLGPSSLAPSSEPSSMPSSEPSSEPEVITFVLKYTIVQSRFPLPSEYETVVNNTNQHLNNFLPERLPSFDGATTSLLDMDFSFGDPVRIAHSTAVLFDTGVTQPPNATTIEQAVRDAFVGMALSDYLDDIRDLPVSNIFSTTSNIAIE